MNAKPIIFLGLTAFIPPGAHSFNRALLVNIGLAQSGTDDQKTNLLSPLVGGLAVVGGIVLVIIGTKKSS